MYNDQFEYKLDTAAPDGHDINEFERYLNDRGMEGWQVAYASNRVIWWMRRKAP